MKWMNRSLMIICCLVLMEVSMLAQTTHWPQQTIETRPGSRWWWLGSAVDEANLTRNLEAYVKAGIGTLEITPIYGVQGNDANDVAFLSERWIQLYQYCQKEARRLGIKIDMNTGTGWPFGGPQVTQDDAAAKLIIAEYRLKKGESLSTPVIVPDERQKNSAKLLRLMAFPDKGTPIDLTHLVVNNQLNWKAPKGKWRLIAAFSGHTFQQVKRAAPGGEGLVADHFSSQAIDAYLNRFSNAFNQSNATMPNSFFNDSYEVYGADWTSRLFEEFEARRGYKLEYYLPQFLDNNRNETIARIISDYRETLSELLLENFTHRWTQWSHSMGSKTRSQAHGSPGNLIDLYAAVDIPECEGFGLSEFNIRGLRKDSLTRHNDSDLSMLKYASSAAHISGKRFTSSETFTWLTEHFRTSLAQCKPDLDLMFVSGVNRVFFHGTTYSPADVAWPGWKFYASVDMSPTNPLWRDVVAFNDYISRAQSFLQLGEPDNDFLLYLPIYDMWHEQEGRLLMFDIHKMAQRAPEFIDAVHQISNAGYDVDYISDSFIKSAACVDGKIKTKSGQSYKALIVPGVKRMPADVLAKLVEMAKDGATIIFMDFYPIDVPGFASLNNHSRAFNDIRSGLPVTSFNKTVVSNFGKGRIITGNDYAANLKATGVLPELMKPEFNLQSIRRKNDTGHHYFIAALNDKDTNDWITLGVKAKSAMLFNPLNGEVGKAKIRHLNGLTQVKLQIKSGESIILKTFENEDVNYNEWLYYNIKNNVFALNNDWVLHFPESTPPIAYNFVLKQVEPWTNLNDSLTKINMGTGVYRKTFSINKNEADDWILDLGDVRETARVKINGNYVATLWSVPYQTKVGKYLKNGLNTIEIEVTSLPANYIAHLDRQGVRWRNFKEINFVDLNYKTTGYGHWQTMPAGLNGDVKLIPVMFE